MKNLSPLTLLIMICGLSLFAGCSTPKKVYDCGTPSVNSTSVTSPRCIIYKTRADYSGNIPVLMNKEKNAILSYPDVKDVCPDGNCTFPIPLEQGFLLDVRGIGINVAFLRVHYQEYAKMKNTPGIDELKNMILDDDPLLLMYEGKPKAEYKDIEKELNALIREGKLNLYRKLK